MSSSLLNSKQSLIFYAIASIIAPVFIFFFAFRSMETIAYNHERLIAKEYEKQSLIIKRISNFDHGQKSMHISIDDDSYLILPGNQNIPSTGDSFFCTKTAGSSLITFQNSNTLIAFELADLTRELQKDKIMLGFISFVIFASFALFNYLFSRKSL